MHAYGNSEEKWLLLLTNVGEKMLARITKTSKASTEFIVCGSITAGSTQTSDAVSAVVGGVFIFALTILTNTPRLKVDINLAFERENTSPNSMCAICSGLSGQNTEQKFCFLRKLTKNEAEVLRSLYIDDQIDKEMLRKPEKH